LATVSLETALRLILLHETGAGKMHILCILIAKHSVWWKWLKSFGTVLHVKLHNLDLVVIQHLSDFRASALNCSSYLTFVSFESCMQCVRSCRYFT